MEKCDFSKTVFQQMLQIFVCLFVKLWLAAPESSSYHKILKESGFVRSPDMSRGFI